MILKDTVVPSERPHPHANAVRGRLWNGLKQGLQRRVNSHLTAYLNEPDPGYQPITIGNIDGYTDRLVAGDVILIAGHSRFATLIKYLTQSPWSHVVLFAGMIDGAPLLIEADIESGVRSVSFESLRPFHVRVMRPLRLEAVARAALIAHVSNRMGHCYDLSHVISLARFMLPWRLGSPTFHRRFAERDPRDPTKVICSTLIADAFAAAGHSILPPGHARRATWMCAPRDFDMSPQFVALSDVEHAGDFGEQRIARPGSTRPGPAQNDARGALRRPSKLATRAIESGG